MKRKRKTFRFFVIDMLVKVLRRLTLQEVEKRIEALEKTFSMSFDEFEERLLTAEREEEQSVDAYLRWGELMHAYRGYVEGGELHSVIEEVCDFSSDRLGTLTARRLELLHALSDLNVESINDLTRKVRRDVKNVYQDLKVLEKLGFVDLSKKRGRRTVPEILVEEITFLIQ